MSQRERDDEEWNDPANWHGGILGIYYSKRDSRSFVPKRNPLMGVTINFARPGGIVFLFLILAFAVIMVVLTTRHPR
jgi:uncharacterized membrane protein